MIELALDLQNSTATTCTTKVSVPSALPEHSFFGEKGRGASRRNAQTTTSTVLKVRRYFVENHSLAVLLGLFKII